MIRAGKSEQGRVISLGSVLLVLVAGLTLWVVSTTSGTWGYFSNTLQELASITTGFWEETPGQSGTSIQASKTAEGYWEYRDLEHYIGVRGEVCVTNRGEQPTENLKIIDTIQSKKQGSKYQDYEGVALYLGSNAVLAPGETRCYPYVFEVLPVSGAKYRNVAYVTITNHSGWIPGGQNCPGPELCEFGPAPKAGFEIPPPPDFDGDNISSPAEFIPDTGFPGSPEDADPEGKLIELPGPPDGAPSKDQGQADPANPVNQPPGAPDIPLPTPAPTMEISSDPTPEAIFPFLPAPYAGPKGCTRPLKYWLNHANKWGLEEFFLGGEVYELKAVFNILSADPGNDISYLLAQQYFTALLNIASPADPQAVMPELIKTYTWFERNALGGNPGQQALDAALELAASLESYNLGETGPGSCDSSKAPIPATEDTSSKAASTPSPTPAPTMAVTALPTLAPTPTPASSEVLPTPNGNP